MSELDLTYTTAAAIGTPAANQFAVFVDSADKRTLAAKNDAAEISTFQSGFSKTSIAAQSPAAATRTYLTNSNLKVPGLVYGQTILRWRFSMTKTAAGTAASTIEVVSGQLPTTAAVARLSFTKPAGTAAIDEAWCEICVTVRAAGASGVLVGTFQMTHNLAATGHATIPCVAATVVSSSFDLSEAGLQFGLCITTGASDVITIQHVQAEALRV